MKYSKQLNFTNVTYSVFRLIIVYDVRVLYSCTKGASIKGCKSCFGKLAKVHSYFPACFQEADILRKVHLGFWFLGIFDCSALGDFHVSKVPMGTNRDEKIVRLNGYLHRESGINLVRYTFDFYSLWFHKYSTGVSRKTLASLDIWITATNCMGRRLQNPTCVNL